MIRVLLLLTALLLAGCVKQVAAGVQSTSQATDITPGAPLGARVYRITDPQYGVACYVPSGGGISCVKVAGGAP